jgi:hypothetical protein
LPTAAFHSNFATEPNGVLEKPMDTYTLLFNQTIDSLRRVGARGGKATARNRRARQKAGLQAITPGTPAMILPTETTAQAIARLNAGFPWLRDAERRRRAH